MKSSLVTMITIGHHYGVLNDDRAVMSAPIFGIQSWLQNMSKNGG